MLESAPAGQLQSWREYVSRHPFGDDWEQTSVIAAEIINQIRVSTAQFGSAKIKKRDLLDIDNYVPKQTSKKKQALTMRQSAAALRGMTGV